MSALRRVFVGVRAAISRFAGLFAGPDPAKAAAKTEAPTPAATPAAMPARTPSSWELAVGRIRETCNWLIGTMGTIAAAAVGSGAVLSFKNAGSLMRVGWLIWGLSMTVAGALVVMWRATLVKLPVSGSISALIAPATKQFRGIAERIDQDLTKQGIPTVNAEIVARMGFEAQCDDWRRKAIALTGSETPEDKRNLALANAQLEYYRDLMKESADNSRASLHRAMYLSHRKRFRQALPWIFLGALMVAVGFPTYFAAARLDTTETDKASTAATGLAAPVPASVTITAARFKGLVVGCTDQSSVRSLVLGGNGSAETPWRLRVGPSQSCPSAFDLDVTREEAQLALDVVDPVLTAFLAVKAPAPADVKPERNPVTAFSEARLDQQVSMCVWIFTALAYIGLVVFVAREVDDESGAVE